MDNFINQAILWLQLNISAESLTVWLFLVCAIAIFGLLRFYGAFGLYVYNALAIVIANIQVLCFTQYSVFTDPVAQGTILFTTTFFVNDVLTEHYGVEYAKKSIMLGFWAQLLVTAFMLLTLSHPLPNITNDPLLQEGNLNYSAMQRLFTPSVRILLASLISYVCSQCLDIYIFNWLRAKTTGRFLWLRQNVAMFASGIFDTCLFSILAWMVFSNTPITWHELFFNYIISAQIMRFILNFSFTPLMYVSNFCVPKRTISVFDLKERTASS